jgi:hypothetical protein
MNHDCGEEIRVGRGDIVEEAIGGFGGDYAGIPHD